MAKLLIAMLNFVVIATPTNYDPVRNYFDTTHVEEVIKQSSTCKFESIIIIKSTIPVGYTESVRQKFNCENILFAPEFLREKQSIVR